MESETEGFLPGSSVSNHQGQGLWARIGWETTPEIKDPAEAGSTIQKGAGGALAQEAKRYHNRLHQDAHV